MIAKLLIDIRCRYNSWLRRDSISHSWPKEEMVAVVCSTCDWEGLISHRSWSSYLCPKCGCARFRYIL